MKKILIIKHGAFGDIVLSLYAIFSINNHFKNSEITILTESKYGNFFKKGDPKDLALKVLEMTNNTNSIYEKSLKAREYAINNFSIKNMAETYFDYLML